MSEALFIKILVALVAVAIGYGAAVTIIILTIDDPSDQLVSRFIGSFGAIFGGLLGFCTGYLAGVRRNGNGNHKP